MCTRKGLSAPYGKWGMPQRSSFAPPEVPRRAGPFPPGRAKIQCPPHHCHCSGGIHNGIIGIPLNFIQTGQAAVSSQA